MFIHERAELVYRLNSVLSKFCALKVSADPPIVKSLHSLIVSTKTTLRSNTDRILHKKSNWSKQGYQIKFFSFSLQCIHELNLVPLRWCQMSLCLMSARYSLARHQIRLHAAGTCRLPGFAWYVITSSETSSLFHGFIRVLSKFTVNESTGFYPPWPDSHIRI